MTDKDFEIRIEAQAALLTNDGYFTRYRQLIASVSCRRAWEQVESEMPFGGRRFLTYESFKDALRKERRGELSEVATIKFIKAAQLPI